MKILITDNTHPALVETLQGAGIETEINTHLDYDSLLKIVNNYDGLVVRSKIIIDKNFLEHCSRLKCIGRVGAGMDTIDVEFAESKGIHCINSPEGNRDAVGEHATALLLALFDKITLANAEVRQGLWHREENRGLEVKGKTVGIIGFGNMGHAFAQRLQGFECRIIAYDKYKMNYGNRYTEAVSLEELQHEADIISLHVPLTDETHYMIDEDFIEKCKKPFYLVNTSRGAVVKTKALATAMQLGKVQGAALDVMEYEDMSKDGLDLDTIPEDFKYLLESKHTVLTPHVGGWTVESKYKLAYFLGKKMADYLNNCKVC